MATVTQDFPEWRIAQTEAALSTIARIFPPNTVPWTLASGGRTRSEIWVMEDRTGLIFIIAPQSCPPAWPQRALKRFSRPRSRLGPPCTRGFLPARVEPA